MSVITLNLFRLNVPLKTTKIVILNKNFKFNFIQLTRQNLNVIQ